MSYLDYLKENRFRLIGKTRSRVPISEYYIGHIVGLGANILNGYSYEPLSGNLTYLTNVSEAHNHLMGLGRLVYLKDYPKPDLGFSSYHVATSERTICDFMMYPDELCAMQYIHEAILGYIDDDETPNDFHLVYNMMDKLGIDTSTFEMWLERVNSIQDY